jgi:hypothetical protein
LGKEQEARVGRMLAGGEVLDLGEMFGELATAAEDFAKKIK